MDIGTQILRIREAAGETQQEMADALGISGSHLSQMENGRRLPSLGTLAAFRKLYGLDPYILAALADPVANVTWHMDWDRFRREKEKE